MLWILPTAVFTAANLWGYMGREIPYFNLRPDNSIVDRAVASAKLASAVYGIEYIGVGVANITMSSYGQKTIDQPKQDDQSPSPFIEAASSPADIIVPHSESESSSPEEEGSWKSILYDFFTLWALRPRLSGWTVCPEILTGLLAGYLALLSFILISLREKIIDIQERALVVHQILHTLGITIVQFDTILGVAKKTLSTLPEENTRIRESAQTMTVKMNEVLGGMGGVQEWHDNNYKGICEQLQSLESAAQTTTVKIDEMLGEIGRIQEWQDDKYKGVCEQLQSLELVAQPIVTPTKYLEIDLNKSLDVTDPKDSLAETHALAKEESKKPLAKDRTSVPVPSTNDEIQNSTSESKLPLNPEQPKTAGSHGPSEDSPHGLSPGMLGHLYNEDPEPELDRLVID